MLTIPIRAFTDNYIWSIIDRAHATMICVDPGDAKPVLQYTKSHGLTLQAILLTHHHHDHIGGAAKLKETFKNCKIFGPDDARIPCVTDTVADGGKFNLGNLSFEVLKIPGHTSSHICFIEKNDFQLFCGDTLFSAGCGRVFDGTHEELFTSLQLLKTLDERTKVFCGHEYTRKNLEFAEIVDKNNHDVQKYKEQLEKDPEQCSLPSTIKLEKKINPFLRTNNDLLHEFIKEHNLDPQNDFAIFKKLRDLKDNF